MTALDTIDLSYQQEILESPFEVPSTLLPILHKGLVLLDLRQDLDEPAFVSTKWDPISLFHLGQAVIDVSTRVPVPTLVFES
jgi:hypothetical protein